MWLPAVEKLRLFTLFAKPTPEQRKNILEHLKIAERCMSQCQKSIGALNLNRKRRQKPKPLKGPMSRASRRKKNRSLCWTPLSVPQRTWPRALHSSFRPTAGLAASPSIRPTCAPRFSRVLAMNSSGRFCKRRLRNAVVQRFEAARSKPACATAILKRVNGHKEPPEARKMRARTDTPSYSRSRRCTVARFTRGQPGL
jgi:hypothetical protein